MWWIISFMEGNDYQGEINMFVTDSFFILVEVMKSNLGKIFLT